MKIEHLKLTNFRNYTNLELSLNSNINIFIGENGEGKTNILESIYLLALSKTNRSNLEADLIKFNEEIAKVEGIIRSYDLIKKKEIHLTRNYKKLFINNKEIKKNRDYIKDFSVISFEPKDLDIIKGSPLIRRNVINIDISQLDNSYITYLNKYNQIVKMRNDYLKKMNLNGNTDPRFLDVINQELINNAVKIYEKRFNFFEEINNNISSIYKKITNLDNLKIVYNNNLGIVKFNKEEIINKFKAKLNKNINVELMQGMTLTGPHRDDFSFILMENDLKNYGSQGQQRMAIIAFKISEIYLFKKNIGEYPVLLLDDIFSEIDEKKRNKIIKYFKKDIQIIITTTDINNIDNKILSNSVVYKVKNSKVTKKGMINNGRGKSNK